MSIQTQLDDRVLQHIRKSPGCTALQIAEALTPGDAVRTRIRVHASMARLESAGLIRRGAGKNPIDWHPTCVVRLDPADAEMIARVLREGVERRRLGPRSARVAEAIEQQVDVPWR